jgi:hypothetical protein
MSISNPMSPNFGWKVDPDNRQNRTNGPCLTRQLTVEEKIKYGIAVRKDDDTMLKMTKKEVLEMAAAGKTIDEIVEHFTQGNTKHRSMYLAKATLFVNGPKEKSDEVTKDKTVKDSRMMPATLKTRMVEDAESMTRFELADESLMINQDNEIPVCVQWDKLDTFITNLQTIKQIHEAV